MNGCVHQCPHPAQVSQFPVQPMRVWGEGATGGICRNRWWLTPHNLLANKFTEADVLYARPVSNFNALLGNVGASCFNRGWAMIWFGWWDSRFISCSMNLPFSPGLDLSFCKQFGSGQTICGGNDGLCSADDVFSDLRPVCTKLRFVSLPIASIDN